jgi:hypothetical protein
VRGAQSMRSSESLCPRSTSDDRDRPGRDRGVVMARFRRGPSCRAQTASPPGRSAPSRLVQGASGAEQVHGYCGVLTTWRILFDRR